MPRVLFRVFVFAFACLLVVGCVPIPYRATPRASGRVIDAESRIAIAGATVMVAASGADAVTAKTSSNGMFRVGGSYRWCFRHGLGMQCRSIHASFYPSLEIQMDGYESRVVEIPSDTSFFSAGDVSVKALPK